MSTQSNMQHHLFYEHGALSPLTTPTPMAPQKPIETEPVIPPEFMNRRDVQSSPKPPTPVQEIVEEKPKKSKLSSLASSRASTKSISSMSSKSSRSFFVDSDSVLTYPALRPSPGSRMSLSSEITAPSEASTSLTCHIRRAVQTAMRMEVADHTPDVVSEPSDASTPRQKPIELELPPPSTPRSPPRPPSLQGRAPSKLALLAQSKAQQAQQNPAPWSPQPRTPRSLLPETHEHNIRTKYVTPIANGPTATTAITISYQSLGNVMSHSRSAKPSTPSSQPQTSAPPSPELSKGSSKEDSKLPKQSASRSPKQSKLVMKIKQSQRTSSVPEADHIEDLGDQNIQPLFLPPASQTLVSPSAFATVLIEEIDPGSRHSGGSKDSHDRSSERRRSKRRSHKDQPIPPAAPSSQSSGFSFDVPSPDDIIFNARKGTSLGDARSKSAHSVNSRSSSNNISSTPKRVSSKA
jgi:hypothetical protein